MFAPLNWYRDHFHLHFHKKTIILDYKTHFNLLVVFPIVSTSILTSAYGGNSSHRPSPVVVVFYIFSPAFLSKPILYFIDLFLYI